MKILLTGASGFVGGNLAAALANRLQITAIYHSSSIDKELLERVDSAIQLDLCRRTALNQLLNDVEPDVILHCAALAQAAACESDSKAAEQNNVDATRNLLLHCRESWEKQPLFVYISTDLVFDGLQAPVTGFLETDQPSAATVYGKSKLRAEQVVRSYPGQSVILRLALVYGNRVNGKQGFLGWLIDKFKRGETVPLFLDEWRTPVSTSDISDCIEKIVTLAESGESERIPSILHLAGSQRVHRVQFGEKVAERFAFDRNLIYPTKRPSERAADVSLSSEKLSSFLGRSPLSVEQGLAAIL